MHSSLLPKKWQFTKIHSRGTKNIRLRIDPSVDRHKVGDKARDGALEYRVISQDDTLPQDVYLIPLRCH